MRVELNHDHPVLFAANILTFRPVVVIHQSKPVFDPVSNSVLSISRCFRLFGSYITQLGMLYVESLEILIETCVLY